MTKVIEVEDWVYEELEHRRRVLGYSTVNELIIDYVIRRAPPIALERRVVEELRSVISTLPLSGDEPIALVIDEVLFRVAEKYGFLMTSVQKLEGTALELLVLRFIEEAGLEYVYRASQVGYWVSKGSISTSGLLWAPDIVYGLNSAAKGVVEVKKQDRFHVSEYDRAKLLYFIKKGLRAYMVTTAPKPQRSALYTSLTEQGVGVFRIAMVNDIKRAAEQLISSGVGGATAPTRRMCWRF